MSDVILAFDPGVTTGYAVLYGGTYALDSFVGTTHIEWLLENWKPTVVVVEKFVLYPWAAKSKVWSSFPTVEIIGVIKHLCGQRKIPVVEQGANEIQTIRPLIGKGDVHARDAFRHAIRYARKRRLDGPYSEYYRLKLKKVRKYSRRRN